MNTANPTTRQELQARVIERALNDDAFRQALIANPTSTIFKELGLDYIPGGPKFQILEETPDILYLVLPMSKEQIAAAANSGQMLGDEELQSLTERSKAYVAFIKD
jgi:hypothetical protein